MSPLPSGGRALRLVSPAVLQRVLVDVVSECLGARGFSALDILRARRAAMRALAQGLRTQSRRVRGLSRAEFLAEFARSRAGFAGEKGATERALAELAGAGGGVEAREERVDVLERRVAKMRRALEEFEQRYRELARRACEEPGLSSVHRKLEEHTPERHRATLTRVFELNLRLQRRSAG
jgi:hypothetical protein